MIAIIGREDSPATAWDQTSESVRWIGKPWRRVESVVNRTYWKGECVNTDRTLSLHVGSRRLGVGVTLMLLRSPGMCGYSEEKQ